MKSDLAAYGCQAKDDEIRQNSSSGGVFSVLAENVLAAGGVVYGTRMAEDCRSACIDRVDNRSDLSVLRGSKYLQSKVGPAFRNVKADLENGLQVLFSGCPCQVNGLKLFLGREYENLICMDIICHGVPSPKLWRRYVEYFENKHNASVYQVNFRAKKKIQRTHGKQTSGTAAFFEPKSEHPYFRMFLKNDCLRPSCYFCSSKEYRKADLSVGDFWGISQVLPELNDGKGTSLVIVRTEKAAALLESVKEFVVLKRCEYGEAVKYNRSEFQSSQRPPQRDHFYQDLNAMSFDKLEKKYLQTGLRRRLRKWKRMILGADKKETQELSYGLFLACRKGNGR